MMLLNCLLGVLVIHEVLTLQAGCSLAQWSTFAITFVICVLSVRKGQKGRLLIAAVAASASIVILLLIKILVCDNTKLHYLRLLLALAMSVIACLVTGSSKRARR